MSNIFSTNRNGNLWVINKVKKATLIKTEKNTLFFDLSNFESFYEASYPWVFMHHLNEKLKSSKCKNVLLTLSNKNNESVSSIKTITRRISRETIRVCNSIDLLAREIFRKITEENIKFFVIKGAENIDQSSIRVLSNFFKLIKKTNIEVHMYLSFNPLNNYHEFDGLLLQSSKILWESIYVNNDPEIIDNIEINFNKLSISDDCFSNESEFIDKFNYAIKNLSFDLAISYCDKAIQKFSDCNSKANSLLLLSTIACNMGEIDKALEFGNHALSLADNPILISRIYYLLGLINAKRTGDINKSTEYFLAGKNVVDNIYNSNLKFSYSDIAHELSWHDNGLAFIEAIKSKKNSNSIEKNKYLDEAYSIEKKALSRISDLSGDNIDYLKYNIVANIVFIYEMKGEYDKAIALFDSIFGKVFLDKKTASYYYRLAILYYKSNSVDKAIELLKCSASSTYDNYILSYVYFALVFITLRENSTEEGLDYFDLLISYINLNDDEYLLKKTYNLICFHDKNNKIPIGFIKKIKTAINESDIKINDHVKHPVISSKLPAYNSITDLLPLPENNINQNFSQLKIVNN